MRMRISKNEREVNPHNHHPCDLFLTSSIFFSLYIFLLFGLIKQIFFSSLPLFISYLVISGIAEPARGRGNSRANLPYFRFINAILFVLFTTFVSRGISEMTFLSAHLPLITTTTTIASSRSSKIENVFATSTTTNTRNTTAFATR